MGGLEATVWSGDSGDDRSRILRSSPESPGFVNSTELSILRDSTRCRILWPGLDISVLGTLTELEVWAEIRREVSEDG